nr:hypothetical protein [Tanacetum cinerariifolium]
MDANNNIDLDNPLCPNESKILANILQNHPPRFSIAASSSVPWIYLGQFWHTLKKDGSKYRLTFLLDRKELTMTLDDFRTIFQLHQATNNNHERFVTASKFLEMVPFFLNDLARVIGYDQSPLYIMQMLYCVVNNVHVYSTDLLWEGLHYSLKHPSTLIPYPRFTKLIISHYMNAYPEISRRVHDKYHNLEYDEIVTSIFNSGKNKIYPELFGVDVPTTQSQPIESTQGTHRTTSASRRLTCHTPPTPISTTPILTAAEVEDITLRDTIQLSIAEQKSHDHLEAQQSVEKVKEYLVAEEIEKLVEGTESEDANDVDNSILNSQNDPRTRLDLRSYMESPEVEKTDVVQLVNIIDYEKESYDYEL